jgi:hypothetical protein
MGNISAYFEMGSTNVNGYLFFLGVIVYGPVISIEVISNGATGLPRSPRGACVCGFPFAVDTSLTLWRNLLLIYAFQATRHLAQVTRKCVSRQGVLRKHNHDFLLSPYWLMPWEQATNSYRFSVVCIWDLRRHKRIPVGWCNFRVLVPCRTDLYVVRWVPLQGSICFRSKWYEHACLGHRNGVFCSRLDVQLWNRTLTVSGTNAEVLRSCLRTFTGM